MAELTNLEEKLAEVIGLAMAAQAATERVEKLLDSKQKGLARSLKQMRKEAAEAEQRATEVAGTLQGKKGAVLKKAREVRGKAQAMMKDYLERGSDGLDGYEFLTMAEAGEVGHWAVLGQMNKQAGNKEIRSLVSWQLPIQRRHLKDVQAGALTLAADEDPNATG
ncbi:MAG TPA: hypothetical protein VK874_15065 [Gaiellaceae bacterium]|nr:hypothetical protein [Gaiellaceae bacterium]